MLKLVELHMAGADRQAQLQHDISHFEETGRHAAIQLLTINHLIETRTSSVSCLASKLLGIVGLLPTLRKLLTEDLHATAPNFTLLPASHVETISEQVNSCCSVVKRAEAIVSEADGWVRSKTAGDSSPKTLKGFYSRRLRRELHGSQNTLTRCFRELTLIISTARARQFERFSFTTRTEDEVRERIHLREALRHPDYKKSSVAIDSLPGPASTPAKTSDLPAPSRLFQTFPTQRQDVLELQHPRRFRGRYGHLDYPFPHGQPTIQLAPPSPELRFDKCFREAEPERYNLHLEGRYPEPSTFNIWPPSIIEANTVQDHQIQAVMSDTAKDAPAPSASSASEAPANTPNTTRDSTPADDSDKGNVAITSSQPATASTSQTTAAPWTSAQVTSGPASTATAATAPPVMGASAPAPVPKASSISNHPMFSAETSNASPFTLIGASSPFPRQTWATTAPATNPSAKQDPPEQLEAYMLRPLSEDVHLAVEWSYEMERLPIKREQLESHIRSLGPNYSVLNSIGELKPEEWRLISIRVKNRHGHLMSVQLSCGSNLVTKMGTFKVKSVIFVLATSHPDVSEQDEAVKPQPGGLFSLLNANPPQGGLFGVSAANPSQGGFGTLNAPFGGFGASRRGGLFGDTVTQNNSGGGLFGNQASQSSSLGGFGGGGLFGKSGKQNPSGFGHFCTERFANKEDRKRAVASLGTAQEHFLPYIEKDGTASHQHFQSITFQDPYGDHSFEELRLADYSKGRTGPGTTPGLFGSPKPQFGGLFGKSGTGFGANEQAYKPTNHTYTPGPQPTQTNNAPSSSLFGTAKTSAPSGSQGSSSFGANSGFETSGGLFANNPFSSQTQPSSGPSIFAHKPDGTPTLRGTNTNTSTFASLFSGSQKPSLFSKSAGQPFLFSNLENKTSPSPFGAFGRSSVPVESGTFGGSSAPSTSVFGSAPTKTTTDGNAPTDLFSFKTASSGFGSTGFGNPNTSTNRFESKAKDTDHNRKPPFGAPPTFGTDKPKFTLSVFGGAPGSSGFGTVAPERGSEGYSL